MGERRPVLRLLCIGLLAAAGCGGTGGTAPVKAAPAGEAVVVASFNFPESELLADIYAQALAGSGVPVRTELDLGTREMVMPAFQQGLVDVVPEYLGSALQALQAPDPAAGAAPSDTAVAVGRLDRQLARWHGRALTPSPAQDQNGLAVTRQVADRYGLRTVSDLARLGGRSVLTGPPECPARPYCLIGLRDLYRLSFAGFVPLDTEAQRITAIEQGVATEAVVFTSSGALAGGDPVLLADDRGLQPPENVTPIVSGRAVTRFGARLTATLDRVSSRLSTRELEFLNWRVSVTGRAPAAEAHGWLVRQGLVARPGQGGAHGR